MRLRLSSSLLLVIGLSLNATGQSKLPPDLDDDAVRGAFQEARERVNQENQKISSLPPTQGAASVRQSIQQVLTPRSLDMEKKQVVFEEATRVLAERYNLENGQIAEDLPSLDLKSVLKDGTVEQCQAAVAVNCDAISEKYRTIDGSCNNPDQPTWGMASSCFNALISPSYSDGVSAFRQSRTGSTLPNPRYLSLNIHQDLDEPSDRHSHMLMMVGQFIAHDISWTAASVDAMNNSIGCCPVQEGAPAQCAPILPPQDDPYYSPRGIDCLNNVRASVCATCALGPRKNTNQVSSYIDLSQLYGPRNEIADGQRAYDGSGFLKASDYNGMTLLQRSSCPDSDACSYQKPELRCFEGGDVRVNQHVALTSMHTVFLRYHNMIASSLKDINPHWDDERLYQETRRILGAQWQMVVYGEFLPEVLGPETTKKYELEVLEDEYTQYDPSVNPAVSPEFSVAGFRFGHSIIDKFFGRTSGSSTTSVDLKDLFFFPFDLYQGGTEQYIKGLAEFHSQTFDRWMADGVTRHLYQERGFFNSGLDLASTNIQRGRDTGLPPYVEMLEFCGGPKIQSFGDLAQVFKKRNDTLFARLYKSPQDIDLFSGGLVEKTAPNSILGPTFSCIVALQFRLTKFGDRFYFEHGDQPSSFTSDQLKEIRRTKLSAILCQGSSLAKLQGDALRYTSDRSALSHLHCNTSADP